MHRRPIGPGGPGGAVTTSTTVCSGCSAITNSGSVYGLGILAPGFTVVNPRTSFDTTASRGCGQHLVLQSTATGRTVVASAVAWSSPPSGPDDRRATILGGQDHGGGQPSWDVLPVIVQVDVVVDAVTRYPGVPGAATNATGTR